MASFLSDLKKASIEFLKKARNKIRPVTPITVKQKKAEEWFRNKILNVDGADDKPILDLPRTTTHRPILDLPRTTKYKPKKEPETPEFEPETEPEKEKRVSLKSVAKPTIGGMYYYVYDAKFREKLKWFDLYPLIICIEYWEKGWIGLNLHYIPPQARQELLTALMKIGNNAESESRYMQISYNLLQQVSADKMWKQCVHKYIENGKENDPIDGRTVFIKSKIIEVNPFDWEKVIYLPQEQFVTYTNEGKAKRGDARIKRAVAKTTVWNKVKR